MSTILDALRRSEQQRKLGRAPVYRDAAAPSDPLLLRWISLGAAILLLLALASVAWLLNRPAVVPEPEAMAVPVAKAADPLAAPARTVATPVAHLEGQAPADPRVAKPPVEPRATPRTARPPSPEAVPWLSSLPASFRKSLPKLAITIHVYVPAESQRILYINNRQYQRGEEIPGGVLVEEILPDGVLLQAHGQWFKLPRPT